MKSAIFAGPRTHGSDAILLPPRYRSLRDTVASAILRDTVSPRPLPPRRQISFPLARPKLQLRSRFRHELLVFLVRGPPHREPRERRSRFAIPGVQNASPMQMHPLLLLRKMVPCKCIALIELIAQFYVNPACNPRIWPPARLSPPRDGLRGSFFCSRDSPAMVRKFPSSASPPLSFPHLPCRYTPGILS